jgi:hypothetical protein
MVLSLADAKSKIDAFYGSTMRAVLTVLWGG